MHEIRSSILSGDSRPSSPVARKGGAKQPGSGLGGLTKIAIKREEARLTDQRCEDRLPGVVEETGILFRRRKSVVKVVNVSSRGAMIEAEIEPRIGEQLDMMFAPDNKTRCIVRWVRGRRIGVEFLNETIFWDSDRYQPSYRSGQADQPTDEPPVRGIVERETRHRLLRVGTLYWGGISIPVRLRNISSQGAQLESEQELRPGAEVELDLGEAGFQVAEVRWSKDGQVGLRFADEFDIAALAPGSQPEEKCVPRVLKPAYLETELRPDSPWAARFERLSLTELKMINPEK